MTNTILTNILAVACNSSWFTDFWDHYLTDIAKFSLELLKQSHVVYLILTILLFTLYRKRVKQFLDWLPVFIAKLRKAGLWKVGIVEFERNVPEAKKQRIEEASIGNKVMTGITTKWRADTDNLSRKAIISVANTFGHKSKQSLAIDVAINLLGKRYYADGFIRDHPNDETDSFFEVKILSGNRAPQWLPIITKYSEFLAEYRDRLSRQVKGYLVVILRNDFKGDGTAAMIDLIMQKTDEIEPKILFERDLI